MFFSIDSSINRFWIDYEYKNALIKKMFFVKCAKYRKFKSPIINSTFDIINFQ